MSHVRTEPFDKGYAELWCLLGMHDYDTDKCRHCQRRNTQVEYKPVTD